ncbi:hypothetical protein AA637_01140 [Cyanobacterium sp. HL-69]|uniref:hypothetical protein n=1 Tax=unclassified Cyanobacterium TaxID=2629879 RepID=UPI0008526115|nr:hypothetical protein [Cyanobacterium sp. IPPAS B-1200]AUC59832.1 hypothetical protein AA637_01140 [Cyanobacterium sp. HL-69]OEJ79203.1 hypothetical protein A5482_10655 [Cyanobacterium sp. IPPAS B-1200]
MDKDTRFAFLVIGLPFLGLIYCFLILGVMMTSNVAQDNPVTTGIIFGVIPLGTAMFIWIRASAKAYKKKK